VPGFSAPEIRDIQVPQLEEDEVLVRITQVGFTRRDRLVRELDERSLPEVSDFLVMGHIAAGRVAETGSMVRDLEPGDLVVPTVRRDCEHCIDARSDMCIHLDLSTNCGINGAHGFARELMVEKARYLIKIPTELEELATLITPLSVAEKAHMELIETRQRYNFFCYHDEDKVIPNTLITGLGPVGILTTMLTSLYGYKLTVFGRREADDTRSRIFQPIDLEYINTTRISPEDLEEKGYRFRQIFETTGDSDYIMKILPLMDANAVSVLMAIPETEPMEHQTNIQTARLLRNLVEKNQVILGSLKSGRDAFESAVSHLEELASTYEEQLKQIITHRIPFDDFEELFKLDSREAILPVLVFD